MLRYLLTAALLLFPLSAAASDLKVGGKYAAQSMPGCLSLEGIKEVTDAAEAGGAEAMLAKHTELTRIKDARGLSMCGFLRGPMRVESVEYQFMVDGEKHTVFRALAAGMGIELFLYVPGDVALKGQGA
jgi:hypothetical protein